MQKTTVLIKTTLKILHNSKICNCTVLHFTSKRLSPRFLPQNQIKFLSVKKFYFWLTAFCLASDNLKQEIEKYLSVVCFLAMFLVLQKSQDRPILKLQILFHDVLNIFFVQSYLSFKYSNCVNLVPWWNALIIEINVNFCF